MPKLKLTTSREKKSSETAMIFSIFYGKPEQYSSSSPSSLPKPLKNVLFDVKVNTEFLETARKQTEEPRGRLWAKIKQRDDADADMAQFKEILHLAASHNDKVLELWGDEKMCVFCNDKPAAAVVYQPLCCTYDGYYALADGDRLFALMLSLSKLVEGLDSHAKVRAAVGSSADVPYINGLAVPICSPDGECQHDANVGIANLLRALGKGLFDEKEFMDGGDENKSKGKNVKKDKKGAKGSGGSKGEGEQQKGPSLTAGSKFATDLAMFRDAVEADEWEEDDVSDSSDDEDWMGDNYIKAPVQERIPLRYTAIVGQPIVDGNSKTHLKAGRLTCLVFTSRWESGLLSSAGTREDGFKSFHIIASFHERFIMQPAEFRCSICPTPVLATTMVHRPISFRRETDTPSSAPHRQIILKLLQYIGGKWKYPETKAALGYDGIHHLNDFIVPICRPGSTCEEAARVAAKKFIDQQLPTGANVVYPNLTPDTDLIGTWWVENAGKRPKLVVEKVGRGTMFDAAEKDKSKAKAIKANDKAIENIRRTVKEKRAKETKETRDQKVTAPTTPTATPTATNSSKGGGDINAIVTELEKQKGKIYTYLMDGEKGKDYAAKKDRPMWGGYPLSEESVKLVEQGENEKQLFKPMITMELLKSLKEAREVLEERYGAEAIPGQGTFRPWS